MSNNFIYQYTRVKLKLQILQTDLISDEHDIWIRFLKPF